MRVKGISLIDDNPSSQLRGLAPSSNVREPRVCKIDPARTKEVADSFGKKRGEETPVAML